MRVQKLVEDVLHRHDGVVQAFVIDEVPVLVAEHELPVQIRLHVAVVQLKLGFVANLEHQTHQ